MGWDTSRPYHYLRWTEDGRLLVGGEDTSHRAVKGSRKRISKARVRLLSYLAQVYPALAAERAEYVWEGQKHLFALGYGGNGMTASFLAAKRLLRRYRKMEKGQAGGAAPDLFAFNRGRR